MNPLVWLRELFSRWFDSGRQPISPSYSLVSSASSTSVPSTGAPRRTFPEVVALTPNRQAGRIRPNAVIIHHTSGSYAGSVEWCLRPEAKVSYHCIIARDGRRTILAEDTDRAWHAGASSWQGNKDANSWAIGLAWEGDTYATPLGPEAIASALEYLLPRLQKWGIPASRILTHAQVAPGRKDDTSPAAHRAFLAALGIS